jgi:diketogulonate reductase-like aldo/keto reductase
MSTEAISPIDPSLVPYRQLASGAKMPAIGLGTFGSDSVSGAAIAEAVLDAGRLGYRHFDCAAVYGNEDLIGPSLEKLIGEGVKREELWVTSKLWNDKHTPKDVIPTFRKSLADLHLDYLDLYLVHWPFPNFHPPGCDVNFHDPNARSYIHENFMKTWSELEKLVDEGLIRHLGTSNMTVPKLKLVLRDARVRPACNEMELHPHFQQPELFDFVQQEGLQAIGYCPLGSPGRPERDRTPEDTSPTEDSTILQIAKSHGVHPAEICLKWAVQRGQTPIPFSAKRRNYMANLRAVVQDPLTDAEMAEIAKLDRNCRLIKGQVFCWKENQDWQDLWDINGVITPA